MEAIQHVIKNWPASSKSWPGYPAEVPIAAPLFHLFAPSAIALKFGPPSLEPPQGYNMTGLDSRVGLTVPSRFWGEFAPAASRWVVGRHVK